MSMLDTLCDNASDHLAWKMSIMALAGFGIKESTCNQTNSNTVRSWRSNYGRPWTPELSWITIKYWVIINIDDKFDVWY